MKKKLHITERQMIKEVIQYLKQYDCEDGLMSTSACDLIVQVAIWGGRNHFESVGIIQEALLTYRETSLELLNQEENEK